MKEIQGDIWDFHDKGYWVVITTNSNVDEKGACVMGKGIAKQAKDRYPGIEYDLGRKIQRYGTRVLRIGGPEKLIAFPTKYNWREKANMVLIERSCQELEHFVNENVYFKTLEHINDGIYMVRPGCSNGGLDWEDVKPILEKYLDDRVIVVEK